MSANFVGKEKKIFLKGRGGKIADRMFPITAETENRRGCAGAAGKMGKIWRCRWKVGRDAAGQNARKQGSTRRRGKEENEAELDK